MADLIQLLVSGIATGAIYALAALGFTLLWQAAGVINFAQGEFVMLPAFAMLFCIAFGLPMWLAFLVACALAAIVLGLGFKLVIVDPLIRHGVIPLVIATLGVSIAVKSIVRAGYSAEAHPLASPFPSGQLSLAGVTVSYADIGTLVLAGAIVIALQAFLNKTVTGRAMQAVAQNVDSARVLGINVRRMVMYVFVINAVLAAVAALLVTPTYLAKFDMGDSIGQKAFFAAIIGGFNQTRGALVGGVLIGVIESMAGFYLPQGWKDVAPYIVLLAVLLLKPEGLFGVHTRKKV
jgi:branched-chain amino acid transport system permease protein